MSQFDSDANDCMMPELLSYFGDSAVITRDSVEVASIDVLIDRDFQRGPPLIDTIGNVHGEKQTAVEFQLTKLTEASYTPTRGDVVTVGIESWTLDEKEADDGLTSTWIVY